MATFYGGEQLSSVLRINGTNETGIKYTVPSGKYSRVIINYARSFFGATSFAIGEASFETTNQASAIISHSLLITNNSSNAELDDRNSSLGDLYIHAGETIDMTSATNYSITILEYVLP